MVLIAAPYDQYHAIGLRYLYDTDIDTSSFLLLLESEQGLIDNENLSLFLLYIFFLSLERKNGDSKLSPILA